MVALDYDRVFGSWSSILKEDLFDRQSFYFRKLIETIDSKYETESVVPVNKKDIFRVFRVTPLDELKVVILGQDPYPSDRATGLAFANEDERALLQDKLSPSLLKMKQCIEKTVYDDFKLDFDPTLLNWSKQGVLLLNTALTTKDGSAGAHHKYWSKFTASVLRSISNNKSGVNFLLLGGIAAMNEQYINKKTSNVFKYCHPAYANYKGIDWNCPHFKGINDILEKQNGKGEGIKW